MTRKVAVKAPAAPPMETPAAPTVAKSTAAKPKAAKSTASKPAPKVKAASNAANDDAAVVAKAQARRQKRVSALPGE